MAGDHWWSYNGHKPGQTSCTDFRDEIQTYCNFETHIFRCSHHLGHSYSCSITVFSKPLYNSLAWPNRYTHVLNSFICILYKDFPHTSSSGPSTRSCQQEQQVQVVLIVCYLPHHIVITFSTESGSSSSQLLAWSITGLLAYLNSSLSSGNQCDKWRTNNVHKLSFKHMYWLIRERMLSFRDVHK